MTDFTEYKIVPVEATEPEVDAAYDANDTIDAPLEDGREVARRAVNASRAASPPPGEDLVERVARAFFAATMVDEEAEHRTDAPDTTWEDLDNRGKRFTCRIARAILAEIERKTND